MRARLADDEASVSDVIGSILLVGITVVMAAGFGALLLSFDGPANQVHAQLSVTVGPGSNGLWGANEAELTLRHLGGEALDEDDVTVRYSVAGAAVQQVSPTFAGGALTVGEKWTTVISANAGDAVLVDVVVDAGAQSQLVSTGQASAGSAPALLTYVSTITATAGWGTVTAAGNAGAANDNLDATLQESPLAGTTTTLTRTAGATTNGGASNSNVVNDDDSRSVLDVAGDWVQGSSFTANPGGVAVTDLSIGFQGRGTSTCSTVTHQATFLGTGNGGTTVSSALVSVSVGHVYVAAIASGNTGTAPDVTAVSGLIGVTWTQVEQVSNAAGTSRLEVWVGTGTGIAGVVTATFAGSVDRSAITVSRYSGVDTSSIVQASTTATATGTAVTTGAIAGTATSGAFLLAVNGVAAGGGNPTAFTNPGTERADLDSGSRVQLALAGGAAAASNAGSATLSSSEPWQAIGFTLRPSCTALPSVQLSYLLSGTPAGTPQNFQLTAADADSTIGVIGDRSWSIADIANIAVRVTLPATIAGSTAEIDQVYLVLATTNLVTQHRAEFFLDFNTVTPSATEVVQLRYKTNGADSFVASVFDGSTYRTCPGLLNSITYTVFSCAIDEATEHEATTPNLRVRIQDSTPTGNTRGTILLDYARVSGS